MMLTKEVKKATQFWVTKGNKSGRIRQQKMMLRFAEFAQSAGARHPGQVGSKTVIRYWKFMQKTGRAHATQMDHWRAIRELFSLWSKEISVPLPNKKDALRAVE